MPMNTPATQKDPRLTRASREDAAATLDAFILALQRELALEAAEGNITECDFIHSRIARVEDVVELLTPESD